MRKYLLPLLAAMGLASSSAAQQNPVITTQLNSTYYVKQVSGFYPTIQSAVTKACGASSGATVNIPAGASPSDTIGAVTGGCTNVVIEDDRLPLPRACYVWSGSAYTASDCYPGGGSTSPLTTKGDLYGYSSTNARIPVGPDGQVLTADSTQTLGVKWAPAGSTLTGQTPNYVPLATSTTASSISSHFFEAGGQAGVANSFDMQTHAPNCNWSAGPSFTRYKCLGFDTYDDGSTNTLSGGSRNLAAFTGTHNAWGPGGGADGGVGRETRASIVWADSNNGALATPGTKTVHYSNTSAFGIGDFQGVNYDFTTAAGIAYDSDQGSQLYYRLWETAGPWAATITGGTNTAPTFTTTGGCGGLENQACAPVSGGWMRDLSVPKGNGNATGMTSGALGGAVSWANTVTTNFAPPASAAYGYAINVNLTPNTTWDAPIPQTITLQAGAGTFAAGDHACAIGSSFTEQNVISAVSGTSPTQTITIPLAMPEVSVAIFKGDCMVMTMDADATAGVVYALPVVSVDGSSLIYPYEAFSSNRAQFEIPSDGVTWSKFDGGASSGIHLYAGARILMVGTTTPTAPFPLGAPYLTVTLSPNSTFAVGDAIDSPHYAAQKVDGMTFTAGQTMASTSFGTLTTSDLHIVGQAANSNAALIRGWNDNPHNYYKPDGGPLVEPYFIKQHGYFDSFLDTEYTPASSLFYFRNHQTGQTSYNVLRDPSWGILNLDSSGLHWNKDFFGQSFWGQGIGSFNIGLEAGAGDGAGNNAGTRYAYGNGTTTPTWLAPCYALGNTSSDLCVTSQGAARVAGGGDYYAAADRALQTAGLTMAALPGSPGVNSTITFLTNYGNFDMTMYDGGAAQRYGWGLTGGTMNFVVPSLANSGGHIGFGDTGDLTGSGYMMFLMRDRLAVPSAGQFAWSSTSDAMGTPDTGLSRGSAGVVNVGNGTAGDTSGTIKAGDATFGGSGVCTAGNGRCSSTPTPHGQYYWSIFTTAPTATPVSAAYYVPSALSSLSVQGAGRINATCTTYPTVHVVDIGTSVTSTTGTTLLTFAFTGTGALATSGTISVASGHYLGVLIDDTESCTAVNAIDITMTY